ncbi:MAG: alpha-D-ribose 1-methylphosphonate 5-triphosphate diphosphatase [Alphaproteobacteria bacterium]|nr:alpha-D-ribose 1-methylphosphonate 5-triphosphate diphosphatase [Alphaproteobacteria bacterium]
MQQIISNAALVLADEVRLGSLVLDDGIIKSIEHGRSGSGEDLDGDYLLPGLVDIPSDNIEKHIEPRPHVLWPNVFAAIAHDANVIGVGITTVLDAISLSEAVSLGGADGNRTKTAHKIIEGLRLAKDRDALRADHLFHIRCEVTDPEIVARVENLGGGFPMRLLSLVDHTPGQRVWTDVDLWRRYRKKGSGLTDAELDSALAAEIDAHRKYSASNRQALARLALERGVALAGHDDSCAADIEDALRLGSRLSEFPTTLEAARLARTGGMKVIMGAPNLVRGGSHTGNVSTRDCARAGTLDILASDYMPVSLLHAVFKLTEDPIGLSLPEATRMATAAPAAACGLEDRGEIAPGRRADLVRVRCTDGVPVVRSVWRCGQRVH